MDFRWASQAQAIFPGILWNSIRIKINIFLPKRSFIFLPHCACNQWCQSRWHFDKSVCLLVPHQVHLVNMSPKCHSSDIHGMSNWDKTLGPNKGPGREITFTGQKMRRNATVLGSDVTKSTFWYRYSTTVCYDTFDTSQSCIKYLHYSHIISTCKVCFLFSILLYG